ncbi:hypothetical protein AVEN_158075-1 [Araneus ventricosus]|uniref:Tc1-like transposase DDE domain-containing protein n=1 Tax=Araneus ventricosus TaxID=182803 RepID=A0A4Y2H677_ARAVE|nr:hypothetical protein AVEN_158075-1 [Araneus ventricosus]
MTPLLKVGERKLFEGRNHGMFENEHCKFPFPLFFTFEEITANGIQTFSVTGQRYRYVLRYFVIPLLQQHGCLQDVIFLQDGVPSHIDRLVKQLLRQHFTDSLVISSPFPTAWPLHSSDIITVDFFVGFPEGQYLPQKASISASSEEQHTEPCS